MLMPSTPKIAVFVVYLDGDVLESLEEPDCRDDSTWTCSNDDDANGARLIDGVVLELVWS